MLTQTLSGVKLTDILDVRLRIEWTRTRRTSHKLQTHRHVRLTKEGMIEKAKRQRDGRVLKKKKKLGRRPYESLIEIRSESPEEG